MGKRKNTLLLICFLSFLSCLLIFGRIYSIREKGEIPSPAQTKTSGQTLFLDAIPSPSPSAPPVTNTTKSYLKQKVINLLPITTEDFIIEYSPDTDIFFIIATHQPKELCYQRAEDWLRQQGLTNLAEINIIKKEVGEK
ncbi:hypothetical protein KBI33_01040 [Candidatus Shapirobacteria bacterium]|nr:hypothetical protein [Candidatus Shapirobacteria bacterium]